MNAPAHSSAKAIWAQRDGGTARRRSRSERSAAAGADRDLGELAHDPAPVIGAPVPCGAALSGRARGMMGLTLGIGGSIRAGRAGGGRPAALRSLWDTGWPVYGTVVDGTRSRTR